MTNGAGKKPGDSRTISIRGVREHNLKNVDVTIPRDQLVLSNGRQFPKIRAPRSALSPRSMITPACCGRGPLWMTVHP